MILNWIDLLAVKYLFKRKSFTKLEAETGRYWSDNLDMQNKSDHNIYVLVLEEKK